MERTGSTQSPQSSRLIRIGNIYGFTGGSFAGMVYDPRGLCPTINTMGGGQREPLIIEYETHGDTEEGAER